MGRLLFSLRPTVSHLIRRHASSLSHVTGPTQPPLINVTTGQYFDTLAEKYGHLPAIISKHQNTTLTFKELNDYGTIMAKNLYLQGIRPGDKVAILAGNTWQYCVAQVGLGRLGAPMVPMNPAFTPMQCVTALRRSEARALISSLQLSRGPRKEPKSCMPLMLDLIPELGSKTDTPSATPLLDSVYLLDGSIPEDMSKVGKFKLFSDLLRETPESKAVSLPADLNPDDVINMQFTSGTTAEPKIACLTHRNLLNNGFFIGERMKLRHNDRLPSRSESGKGMQDKVCSPPPLFHCFGLVLCNLAAFTHGSCIVYAAESFDPVATLRAVREEKCTAIHGVPTMFTAILEQEEEIKKGGLQYLRTGIASGSTVPSELMTRIFDVLGVNELTICYGMTETSPVSFMTTTDDPFEMRTSTVGRILPHSQAMVVAPDDPNIKPLPLGERGELLVAGYLLQKHYYKDEVKTNEAMVYDSNGTRWMRSGDEGMIDSNGYLKITGRIKDLIIRGGENIHPVEIENVLYAHPKIAQASIVGVPDKKYNEVVGAFVVVRKHNDASEVISAEEVKEWVAKHLGHYMIPQYVFFVEDFPKTASGKVRKVDLRATAADIAKGMTLQDRQT